MAQTEVQPYNTTKTLAVIFTVISLLGACGMAVFLLTSGDTNPAISLFSWAVFEVLLVLVIIYEWPVFLIVCLVVLAIWIIFFTLSIEFSLKSITKELQSDPSISSKEEANTVVVVFWIIYLAILIFQILRYYFVAQVYRYGRKNRAFEAAQSQPPVYSVRPAELP